MVVKLKRFRDSTISRDIGLPIHRDILSMRWQELLHPRVLEKALGRRFQDARLGNHPGAWEFQQRIL